jgi:hypothetical protein
MKFVTPATVKVPSTKISNIQTVVLCQQWLNVQTAIRRIVMTNQTPQHTPEAIREAIDTLKEVNKVFNEHFGIDDNEEWGGIEIHDRVKKALANFE